MPLFKFEGDNLTEFIDMSGDGATILWGKGLFEGGYSSMETMLNGKNEIWVFIEEIAFK